MKVLIISDSHGWEEQVEQIIDRHRNEVDYFIHCGDSELQPSAKALEGVHTVAGNCDLDSFPEEIIIELQGKRFYITHGHLYNVNYSLMNLMYRSEEVNADIVCYGHSHVPACEKVDDVLYINPGSIKMPRRVTLGTYAIYSCHESEKEAVTYYDREGNALDNWIQTF
jgi:uncharacterized protein